MHLIEIFLPLSDNDGKRVGEAKFAEIRRALTEMFGGTTAFTRAPAQGTFESDGHVAHDDIVIFEVMAETLDREWWRDYRATLERAFAQDEILIRTSQIERI